MGCVDLPTRTINVLPYGHPSVRVASAFAEDGIYPRSMGTPPRRVFSPCGGRIEEMGMMIDGNASGEIV